MHTRPSTRAHIHVLRVVLAVAGEQGKEVEALKSEISDVKQVHSELALRAASMNDKLVALQKQKASLESGA